MRIRDFLIGSCGIGVFFAGICSSYAQYPDVAVLLQSLGVGIDGDGNLAGNYEKERWKQFWSFLLKSQNEGKLEPFKNSFKEKAGSISSECCPYGFTESEYGVDTLCGGFLAGTGLYYDATAADFQREGEQREMFKAMIREIEALAKAMGIPFEQDMVQVNLHILSGLAPEATTSMQRDIMAGKASEIQGLVYDVVKMGETWGVSMPAYTKAAEYLQKKGL